MTLKQYDKNDNQVGSIYSGIGGVSLLRKNGVSLFRKMGVSYSGISTQKMKFKKIIHYYVNRVNLFLMLVKE